MTTQTPHPAGHTPGPWYVTDDLISEGECTLTDRPRGGGSMIATTGRSRLAPECRANAALIAAAPDLLAACEAIAAWEPSAAPNEPGGMSIMDAIDIASAAIRKARGQ